jgi:O-antigen ligase
VLPNSVERRISLQILVGALGVTLTVTPWFNLDPINLPKFLILVSIALAVLGCSIPYFRKLQWNQIRVVVYALSFFCLSLISSFFLSGAGLMAQLYGAFGRNTGLLTYLSLAILFFGTLLISSRTFITNLVWTLLFAGSLNALYGVLQWFNRDPIAWNNPYNSILGTFGNPNFVSAFLGMVAVAILALALNDSYRWKLRAGLSLFLGIVIFLVFESDSSQGLMIFLTGAVFVLYLRFLRTWHWAFRGLYCLVALFSAIGGLFGVFNKGPLASLLFQDSVTYRVDYWQAGWNMTLNRPLFGVGLDAYGDWFRIERSEVAALRRGPDVTSNSAHNVFIDLSSNGGFPLVAGYAILSICVLRSALRLLRNMKKYDATVVALIFAWVAYVTQSLVSINQIGLAIWGWILGGSIIGYDLFEKSASITRRIEYRRNAKERVPASVVLTGSIGLLTGFLVSIWPVVADVSFRNALRTGDVKKIQSAVENFPQNVRYSVTAAELFLNESLYEESLKMARNVMKLNPLDYNGWRFLYLNPTTDSIEKDLAKAKMKELDPFNNTLGD